MDLARGTEIGREALLRWSHPEHGPIAPEAFVPAAEDSRLIGELGAWALTRAAAEAASWPPGVDLWVNVSPVQLGEADFERTIETALGAAGLTPERLVLEITETALMQSGPAVEARLARLRARGLRIALDDFGAGYSSLGRLRRLPFDAIKLDGSFVAALDDPTNAAIVEGVLTLGARLGVPVIAEGVETTAQRDALAAAGCSFAQGIALAPPRPAGGT
jgi:EAL domain-containing protein (putative c-di-GMP-specific phosphodiesterase class I)